jgi:DNA topoisomerase VI subunit A
MARKISKKAAAKAAPSRSASARSAEVPATSGSRRGRAGKERDAVTKKKVISLADAVAKSALSGREPRIEIPTRSRSNTVWNKKRRILQMGDASQERQLFNLNQAKQFMQTLLHCSTIKDLIEQDKTLSLRGMFYKSKHTVAGTSESTFNTQDESDPILEDIEVALGALREELHVFAKKRGTIAGNITIINAGDEINCRRMGRGGWAVPGIVEPDILQFGKCEAKFVLHVEKDTVWSRFDEDRFWEKHNCILTEGSGQPTRGVRRLLRRLNQELGLPVYCLLDCDPWGHYIYSVIKQGSISLAFESERMAVPDAKFIGIRAKDHKVCDLPDDVKIDLSETDIKRAKEISNYPWFQGHKGWEKEIQTMLSNGFKMEVEGLTSKAISYVSEEYVPQRLKDRDWLD